ncbi:chemotaxis protein CheY-P-specific phosphatase CheC [Neobacillus niacini]|uniref:Ig-like domain-containing protein n=1 Tax=Neobacillus niacini TaxID=86668 RepID=UPI00285630D6|nr:Ig-like domain-containing protein [Neobacillus niacini]MDR7078865.1 chemotaxis protein CheY-P-specific phosphatase CheC [Neobacillus niacini]
MITLCKKYLSIFIVFLLIFSNFNGIIVNAAEEEVIDNAPPVLHNVAIDKVQVQPNEQVTVSLDVTDENSGVKEVIVTYQHEEMGVMTENAVYNEETGTYNAKFPITLETRPGKWLIPYIVVIDQNDNSNTYYYADNQYFDNAVFTVINDAFFDETAPEVNSISVDKQEVKFGEEVKIRLDVTDKGSGVDSVSVEIQNENYGYMQKEAIYNPEIEKYEVKIPIEYTIETGKWRVYSVYVSDKQNNWNGYNEGSSPELDFNSSEFLVLADGKDESAPLVNSISVDKQEVNLGEEVTVSLDVSDNQSGVAEVKLTYQTTNGNFQEVANFNPVTGKYESKITVTDNTRPGIWEIIEIYVRDKVYNDKWLHQEEGIDFSSGNFTVINENADVAPPTIQGISVDKTEAHPGDTVYVSIDAVDDQSGIETIEVNYNGEKGGYEEVKVNFNSDTQKYEGHLTINDETRPGLWGISSIYVVDKEYNRTWYYNNEETNLSGGNFTVINENADVSPPTIQGVSVDKTKANPGETVTVSIDAIDDNSGINYISVYFKTGDRYMNQVIVPVYNPVTEKYEVKLAIDDTSRPGIWGISYIYMRDNDYNGTSIYSDELSSANFTVINENVDITPPKVQMVSVDNKEAIPGDEVTVTIDATDEKSEINRVSVSYKNTYGGNMSTEALFNETSKKYEAKLNITDATKPGTWSIEGISVQDTEWNNKYYHNGSDGNDFSDANFTVINESADITPPTVQMVSINKKEAIPGDEVTVTIDAIDEKSGINQVEVYYRNSLGGYMSSVTEFNETSQKYEAKLNITNTTKPGTWSIEGIYVQDTEWNSKYYDNGSDSNDFSNADFTVINENADITPPTVQMVSVDKKEAIPGDKVTVTIDAADEKSEINRVSVYYKNAHGGYMSTDASFNETSQKYEAILNITDTTKPGSWSIDGISVQDTAWNYKYYDNGSDSNDFSNANFTVINENADIAPPKVKMVSVDKKEAIPGDEVTVTIAAIDEKSGINRVNVDYRNSYGGYMSTAAAYNETSQKYEAKLNITDTTKPGLWSIEGIYVEDSEWNSKYYSKWSDGNDFSYGDFTVINENADITPPTIQVVSVDKKEAIPGDEVTVTIAAIDEKSGINRVNVDYRNSYGGYMSTAAVYNETFQKYEAKLNITDTTKPGLWSIEGIYVQDTEWNSKYYNKWSDDNDFSNGDFSVINEKIDITPPIIKSVTVDKKEVQPGEKVKVSFEAEDDKSEIQNLELYYRIPNQSEKHVTASLNPSTGRYEAEITFGEFSQSGNWKISYIHISDVMGNERYLLNQLFGYPGAEMMNLSGGDFHVTNINEDVTVPDVISVEVNKNQFVPGDIATVELGVIDSQSGVAFVEVHFSGSNSGYISEEAIYNSLTQKYEAKILIDQYTRPGTWSVDGIRVIDKEENQEYLSSQEFDFTSGKFTVVNENPDFMPPVFHAISVDKKEVQPGGEVTISLDVTDEQSSVSYVYVRLINEYGTRLWKEAVFNTQTDKFETMLSITEKTKPGIWEVESISVSDDDGNSKYIYDGLDTNLSNGSFNVNNDEVDIAAPVFHSISVDKKVVKTGEEVTISVEATDQSGISDLFIGLTNSDDNWYAEYNPDTKKYEIKFTITEEDKPGIRKVLFLGMTDHEDNEVFFVNGKEIDTSNADFTVINDRVDYQSPVFNGVSVDKKVVKPGESVTLSLDIIDAQSDVNYVYVEMEGQNGEYFRRGAIFNEKTRKYEVMMKVSPLFKPGAWRISSIFIYNNVGVRQIVVNGNKYDLSNGEFSVNNNILDSTPPNKPIVDDVSDQTVSVTGRSEAKAKVIVKSGDKELGSVTADFEGRFKVPITAQKAATVLNVFAVDSSENISDGTSITVKDVTAPDAPKVNPITDKSTEVTGTTEAGAEVLVSIGTSKYTGEVDENGNFKIDIPVQKEHTTVTVNAKDSSGNISKSTVLTVQDGTAPEAPTVNMVSDQSTVVTGKTEVGATVSVATGTTKYTSQPANGDGDYSVTIPKQKAGTELTLTAKDAADNVSLGKTVIVVDKTAPAAPTVSTVSDQTTVVTGKTEVGATVTVAIGTTKYTSQPAGSEGNYSVIIPKQKAGTKLTVSSKDIAGNVSTAIVATVVDKTAPAVPTVNTVSDQTTVVTGKTEAGATVTVAIGTTKYTSKPAGSEGNYSVTIPKQKAGTKLTVTSKDIAGNVSTAKSVTMVDKTAPIVPTVNTISDQTTVVTGKTEAGATVTVVIGTSKYTSKADSYGTFKVTIPKQKVGTKLTVTSKDIAGNVSTAKVATVVDKTAPAVPTVNTVSDQTTVVTGKSEKGATVTVSIGTSNYSSKADSYGTYKVTIPKQKAGTKLTITAKDVAGNISTTKILTVIDKTAPLAPKVNTVKSTTTAVTGTAEKNSTIIIKVGSTTIGTATTNVYGNFKVTIKAQKRNTVLSVTATDAAKNVSAATTIKVQ